MAKNTNVSIETIESVTAVAIKTVTDAVTNGAKMTDAIARVLVIAGFKTLPLDAVVEGAATKIKATNQWAKKDVSPTAAARNAVGSSVRSLLKSAKFADVCTKAGIATIPRGFSWSEGFDFSVKADAVAPLNAETETQAAKDAETMAAGMSTDLVQNAIAALLENGHADVMRAALAAYDAQAKKAA